MRLKPFSSDPSLSTHWPYPQNDKPTWFIVGDSTNNNLNLDQRGWGDELSTLVDASKINIRNCAVGARSTRTYIREGHWQHVLDSCKPGDIVTIQFGHNDELPVDDVRKRGSFPGIATAQEQSAQVFLHGTDHQDFTPPSVCAVPPQGLKETVYSFGEYLRRYIQEAKAHGMHPILISWVPQCPEQNQRLSAPQIGEETQYALWTKQIAEETHTLFVDAYRLIAEKLTDLSAELMKTQYFSIHDNVHPNKAGAQFNAKIITQGLKALPNSPLAFAIEN